MDVIAIMSICILTIVSILFLSASKAYDASLRNIAASVVAGLFGLFLLVLMFFLSLGSHSSEAGILLYAVATLVLFGPLIGSYLGIKFLGKKSYYNSMREEEQKGIF